MIGEQKKWTSKEMKTLPTTKNHGQLKHKEKSKMIKAMKRNEAKKEVEKGEFTFTKKNSNSDETRINFFVKIARNNIRGPIVLDLSYFKGVIIKREVEIRMLENGIICHMDVLYPYDKIMSDVPFRLKLCKMLMVMIRSCVVGNDITLTLGNVYSDKKGKAVKIIYYDKINPITRKEKFIGQTIDGDLRNYAIDGMGANNSRESSTDIIELL